MGDALDDRKGYGAISERVSPLRSVVGDCMTRRANGEAAIDMNKMEGKHPRHPAFCP